MFLEQNIIMISEGLLTHEDLILKIQLDHRNKLYLKIYFWKENSYFNIAIIFHNLYDFNAFLIK